MQHQQPGGHEGQNGQEGLEECFVKLEATGSGPGLFSRWWPQAPQQAADLSPLPSSPLASPLQQQEHDAEQVA
jgi:hypothetical protein